MKTADECLFCGEPEEVELAEVWPEDRAFMLDACCEELAAYLHENVGELPRELARELFAEYGFEVRALRGPGPGTGCAIDFGLDLVPVTLTEAKDFVRAHHRHNPPPVSWRFGFGVRNGAELIGVAMVGRPVARMIDGKTTVEVNRVCVAADPPELAEHACSMLYGAAAREAKRRGFAKIITYTLETEPGTSLKAAGWTPEAKTKGGTWNRPGRARTDKAPIGRKVRWARRLAA